MSNLLFNVANTVASDARLHFLQDLVPKTMPLIEALEYQRKKRAELGQQEDGVNDNEEGSSDEESRPSPPEGMALDNIQDQQ